MPERSLLSARDISYRITSAEAVAAITNVEGAARIDQVRGHLPSLREAVVVGEPPSDGWRRLTGLLEAAGDARPRKT